MATFFFPELFSRHLTLKIFEIKLPLREAAKKVLLLKAGPLRKKNFFVPFFIMLLFENKRYFA